MPPSNNISFDHTFKVATNIGYFREDRKWVHVYDSLFLVMSDTGQVLTWQLAKGTSFGEVKSLLEDLRT